MTKPPNRSKYTPKLHKEIVASIRKGRPKETTFRLVGIHPQTGWDWLNLGRTHPDKYPHFVKLAEDIDQAIAEVQAERISLILAAADSDAKHWTAAAWYLERTDPANWGRRDKVEIDAPRPLIQLNQVVLADPEARKKASDFLNSVASPDKYEVIDAPQETQTERQLRSLPPTPRAANE